MIHFHMILERRTKQTLRFKRIEFCELKTIEDLNCYLENKLILFLAQL